MATAHKLPSGNWRVLAYTGTVDGKRQYKSFTAATKREAEYQAALSAVRRKRASSSLTVGEAIDRYIASKSAVLSPKTVREYKGLRRYIFPGIVGERIDRLTDEQIQAAVNQYSVGRKYKTVRNALALLTSSVRLFKADFRPVVTLPQRNRVTINVPTDNAVQALINASHGELRVVILLSAVLGLRRSEICALTWPDIGTNTISVSKAMVVDEFKHSVIKATKTTSSTRVLKAPQFVLDEINALPHSSKQVIPVDPENVTNRFRRLVKKLDCPMRLHDLRHFFASTLLEMGVPDLYAMQRMGHASTDMLKRIYQHVKETKDQEIDRAIDQRMNGLFGKS
jgi:integrase